VLAQQNLPSKKFLLENRDTLLVPWVVQTLRSDSFFRVDLPMERVYIKTGSIRTTVLAWAPKARLILAEMKATGSLQDQKGSAD
jgi:hypothetical protein